MDSSRVVHTESRASNHGIEALDPESYTAHRLQHASPEHLHLTTRRFFIGPIPEGWLNSNRKSWYKRRLELGSYSSRKQSFGEARGQERPMRTMTVLKQASTAARMSFSFPQLENVDDPTGRRSENEDDTGEETGQESSSDDEVSTRFIAPVATHELGPQITSTGEETSSQSPVQKTSTRGQDDVPESSNSNPQQRTTKARSPGQKTWVTAQEGRRSSDNSKSRAVENTTVEEDFAHDTPSNADDSLLQTTGVDGLTTAIDSGSKTQLLGPEPEDEPEPGTRPLSSKSPRSATNPLRQHDPAPIPHQDEMGPEAERTGTGVRFKVSEGVARGQRKVNRKVSSAKDKVANKTYRRETLQEGTIIKMEKMLVKVDVTLQQVVDEFDENESMKVELKTVEKWREFMVVARKSEIGKDDDFRLQMYKTRVIPEIDNESTKKKPTREIRLEPRTTHINLYSSLDKTIVIWHPYKKGTRIVVMRPSSTAHSVEWYTFLRDALGLGRPQSLQISVPDLNVHLLLERPFEALRKASVEAADFEAAMAKTIEAEQAVAGKIITQCMEMLEETPEWSEILDKWTGATRMGLAWKRYDRLEWVHGVNEQKMYGSMAMQHSHDLELRPKEHYPTHAKEKKGKDLEEPSPIEGFLVRLTSQKGVHQRLGKTFFKRLYYSTQNQFLFFNRPARVTPPHPPRLGTISGSNIPSASEIIEKTPLTYDIEPFQLCEGEDQISWLVHASADNVARHDREAAEEAHRNIKNVTNSDGYINMTHIAKVRKHKWGAVPGDEDLESGDDVDYHQNVSDTVLPDGVTKEIDGDRVFELVLTNGLIVRLQAYDKNSRDLWIKRLRALVKYWKARVIADMDTFKSVRRTNLESLNIDEGMEAVLGQFARKWEVSRTEASPQLYHMCSISNCRTLTLSGLLYRKPRRRSTFQRCGVLLTAGQLLIYEASIRKRTGEEVRNIHQEKQEAIDLRDCYVYSGLIVEDDLLYQNRTFDANHPGMGSGLPRVYLDDGWTSADLDVMTCFVVWMNRRRGWFRTGGGLRQSNNNSSSAGSGGAAEGVRRATIASGFSSTESTNPFAGKRAKLRRVAQLGVPGRGMVFKCRSRAERDHWVLSVAAEIDRLVEMDVMEGKAGGGIEEVRFAG